MAKRRAPTIAMVSIALLFVAACATAGAGESVGGRNAISQEVILDSSATNVLQLIRSERPMWLRSRGALTMRAHEDGIGDVPIVVYVDGTRLGTIDDLASVPTHGVTQIRWLSASEATQRFGTGHARGAILVSTKP